LAANIALVGRKMPETRNTTATEGEQRKPVSRRDHYNVNDPVIRRKREELYAGLVKKAELKAILDKSDRSIARLIAHGMPYTQLFGENLFDLEAIKTWLSEQARASRQPQPRGRGRPRIYAPAPPKKRGIGVGSGNLEGRDRRR
jgi:hypothetical protein